MTSRTILHLTDRLSRRGGADWHLAGVIDAQLPEQSVALAVGRRDASGVATCPVHVVTGLDARRAQPCNLNPLVDELCPDVIHVHNVVNPSVLQWAAKHGAVMTIQDHRSFCPARGKWMADGAVCQNRMSRDQCRACFDDDTYFTDILALTKERLAAVQNMAAITVLSQYMRDELILVGVPQDRVHVVSPFVHELQASNTPDTGPPCVLVVGRLVESKGIQDAIAAWKGADTTLPLVFVGDGPLRDFIESRGFEVTGWVNHEQLAAWYGRAQALLLPSRWQEPFGIVGIEALSFQVPVVAYDSGGIGEWHPGPGLVAMGDVAALSNALDECLGQPVAPKHAFKREEATAALERVYQEIARVNGTNACTARPDGAGCAP